MQKFYFFRSVYYYFVMPKLNRCWLTPGGGCPKYKLSAGMDCENIWLPININQTDVIIIFFIIENINS